MSHLANRSEVGGLVFCASSRTNTENVGICVLLGCYAPRIGNSFPMFRGKPSAPSSSSKIQKLPLHVA